MEMKLYPIVIIAWKDYSWVVPGLSIWQNCCSSTGNLSVRKNGDSGSCYKKKSVSIRIRRRMKTLLVFSLY